MPEQQYVIIKTSGRGWQRAPMHLLGPDGNTPLCGTAIDAKYWELERQDDILFSHRWLCRRCRKLQEEKAGTLCT